MDRSRVREKYSDYRHALLRLRESLNMEITDSIIIDGAIQRFEFTFELVWKLMKAHLDYVGIGEARSPREVFREGSQAGIIADGQAWIDMMLDRNLASHTYDEQIALEVYQRIKEKHIHCLEALSVRLEKEDWA